MKLLAIETSCEHATVALLIGDELVQCSLDGQSNHSERLLPSLHELLARSETPLRMLDAIAFGSGPGAFTGLRLACGVAQGLAMGADLGLVPVCSLSALALQTGAERTFVAIDARMGEVYSAAYVLSGGLPAQVQTVACRPQESLSLPAGGDWHVVGSALRSYEATIRARLSTRVCGWDAERVPQAAEVARIARSEIGLGRILPPEHAAPLYIRDKVAFTTAERLARGGRA
jgi:tRNA threonylcarbamoyladenosine biosynthesis protein TsaB